MCELARPVHSSCVQAPGLKSVCPPLKHTYPHSGGAAWLLGCLSRGQRAARGEVKTAEQVEKRGTESVFFWAASQQPDSDRPASRLVHSVQWSRARGDCPVIGPALSIWKTGREHRNTVEHRSTVAVWISFFNLKASELYANKILLQKTKTTK